MFRMCALQHYCGAYITLPLEFHALNFQIEETKCSHQRNISKAVIKQEFRNILTLTVITIIIIIINFYCAIIDINFQLRITR